MYLNDSFQTILKLHLLLKFRTMSKSLSYVSGTSSVPLLGITIGEMFDQTAARYPEVVALKVIHQNITWTYAQL